MITYELLRNGAPTGRTQDVPEPHERVGARAQGNQRRIIEKLAASKKWRRQGAAPVDVGALVEARVAEELAKAAESGQAPRRGGRRKTTEETPAA